MELLTRIRDTQRQHLDEYRQFTKQALAKQQEAISRQVSAVTLARGLLVVLAIALMGLLLLNRNHLGW